MLYAAAVPSKPQRSRFVWSAVTVGLASTAATVIVVGVSTYTEQSVSTHTEQDAWAGMTHSVRSQVMLVPTRDGNEALNAMI